MGKYFGTDGFRGEAGITLTAEKAYKTGRYLGCHLKSNTKNKSKPRVVIGKDNNKMGFAVLEDQFDSIEVSIYGVNYERYKDKFVTDAFVVIKGGLSEAREGYKIVIREIIDPNSDESKKKAIAEMPQTPTKPNVTLWLKMEERNEEIFAKVCDVLDQYQGDIPVKIKIEGKAYTLDQKVRKCAGIEYELAGLLGDKCVVFFEK